MRSLLSLLALVLTLLLAALGPAAAEKRLALVIGNSAYVHAAPLANPLADARAMTAALKATGFDVIEATNADKLRFDGALRSFAGKLAGADVALFFYAGHGLQLGMQNYLVPVDAKLDSERDLEFEAVKLDFVMR
ncbi:MAG: caspase domain-containing protein, partial [Hyphomicrobiaceae bacterium]